MSTYDQLSPYYDLLTASERPYRRQALNMLALAAGETMLEIGCGTGQTLLEAAPLAGETGLLIGLDLSAGMLAQAGKKITADHVPEVTLVRGSGLRLPLPANSCDAVFLGFTLELLDVYDQHRLLAEVKRVLKENGRLVLVTLSAHRQTLASDIYWSLHELFPAAIDCRPIHAGPLLAAAGFTLRQQAYGSMFGLPLAVMQASPGR